MDAPRARSTSASSLCPACGKELDPLRAGQVAILDGAFRYFCDAACKAAYVEISSKRPALDAMTADPPPVVSSGVRAQESGVRAQEPTPSFPAVAPAADREESPPTPRSPSLPDDETEGEQAHVEIDVPPVALEEPEAEDPAPPHTLRSPATSAERASASGPSIGARIARSAPMVGIGAGVLAAIVSLAGEAASAVRLPLALLATAIVVAQVLLRPRDPSEPSPWLVVATLVPAAIAAALARVLGDLHADAHASFVGLAAAGALLGQVLVTRARRDVVEARARAASALAVRAKVVRGDAIVEMDADQVKPGEQVLAEAGETIAVDGIVAAGGGEIAPWTESPVVTNKREGDAVVAGASVISGRVRVNATFTGPERAWLRLATATPTRVDVAAPLVALARRVVERGVPVAAVIVAGATYANNGALADVIVAACAGAYGVAATCAAAAIGLAHARGHVAAQRRGIVYKDPDAFDGAARADIAVVCSRGTILLGEPEIVAVESVGARERSDRESGGGARAGGDKSEVARVMSLAAGAEMGSTHPFAGAVTRAARARGVRAEQVRSALKHSGLGVTALAQNGDKVIVGSRAFLLHEKVSVAIADARVTELEAQGRSVLLVALGGRLVGLLALQDGLRPGARAAVQRLHDAHIEPVLLSGEARDTCETIARALDIEHVRPEILPAERGAEVRALAEGGHVVAAIGHATSDDGALGAADVSIAMGAAGSAPGEWGVALASDDVRDAALALTVPRACRERAKTAAILGAAAQVVVGLGIAFGLAPPVIAPIIAVLAGATALALVREPTRS